MKANRGLTYLVRSVETTSDGFWGRCPGYILINITRAPYSRPTEVVARSSTKQEVFISHHVTRESFGMKSIHELLGERKPLYFNLQC